MRNSIEITRKYQFGYMLLRHIIALLVCALFECCIFFWALNTDIMKYVASGVFAFVYGGMIYANARKLSLFDGKPYTPLQQELKWSVMWGIVLALVTLAAVGLGYFNKYALTGTDSVSVTVSIILNLLVFLFTVPYYGFTQVTSLLPTPPTIAAMIIIPIAGSILGYYSGMKKFDIFEKIDSLTFENEEDEDEDE